jgi:hypothetical protein
VNIVAFAASLSMAIEVVQYVLALGRQTSVTDVIMNILGAGIGYAVLRTWRGLRLTAQQVFGADELKPDGARVAGEVREPRPARADGPLEQAAVVSSSPTCGPRLTRFGCARAGPMPFVAPRTIP